METSIEFRVKGLVVEEGCIMLYTRKFCAAFRRLDKTDGTTMQPCQSTAQILFPQILVYWVGKP